MFKLGFPIILCAFLIASYALPSIADLDNRPPGYDAWNAFGEDGKVMYVVGFALSSNIMSNNLMQEMLRLRDKMNKSKEITQYKNGYQQCLHDIYISYSTTHDKLFCHWTPEQTIRAIDNFYAEPAFQQISLEEATLSAYKGMKTKLEEEKGVTP